MTEVDPNVVVPGEEIIAEPDAGYRWKHLIMAVLLIAGGLWFAYDGWVRWPNENREADRVVKEKEAAEKANDRTTVDKLAKELQTLSRHTDTDMMIQKILAFTLPAFGIFWAAWTLRDTRGRYWMAGGTLHVPGHPPITYDNIRRIDKRKWDRKGVALLHYEHGNPPQLGVLKLDDFAYQRRATDQILERIERHVVPTASAEVNNA